MNKLAQEANPLFTSPINSEKLIAGVWNKFLANKHKDIIATLRAAMQKNPNLQMELTQMFPGFSWPEFSSMPTNSSLEELAATVQRLMGSKMVQADPKAYAALKLYMDQYKLMLGKVQDNASKAPAKPKKPNISPKIKQLQKLLGVPETGLWDEQSNTAFLAWLKAKKWDKYISGNRFTGNIDDAIRAMLIEKDSETPEPEGPAEPGTLDNYMKGLEQKQSSARFKKTALDRKEVGLALGAECFRIEDIIKNHFVLKAEAAAGLYLDEAKDVAKAARMAMIQALQSLGYDV